MKDLKMWHFIRKNLKNNNPVILITVLDSKGSSPGKAEFKMAITKGQKFVGTIGGGQMEFDLLNECEKLLKSKKKIKLHQKLYHSKRVRKLQSGMVCEGNQTNFICSLDKTDLRTIDSIIKSFENSDPALFVLTPEGVSYTPKKKNRTHINYKYVSENDWQYEENIGVRNTIYIVGGGHVGLALSQQMKLLGFRVIIFDDRPEVQTIKENYYADEIIIASYSNISPFIDEGEYSYVAIVTSALPTDKAVLKQIINYKLKYIGLMGSKVKLKRIFDELKDEGVKAAVLKKVNAPIGIEINGNSVEEIAVSIAAEIIKAKNF